MRFRRLALLLTVSIFVWLWSSCDSKGAATGGRGSIGPGTTATYLVFTDGAQVGVQSINPAGTLTPILGPPFQAGTNPSNVVVTPDGKFIYVLNKGSNSITQFSIAKDGTLKTTGADILTGTLPVSIAVDASQKLWRLRILPPTTFRFIRSAATARSRSSVLPRFLPGTVQLRSRSMAILCMRSGPLRSR